MQIFCELPPQVAPRVTQAHARPRQLRQDNSNSRSSTRNSNNSNKARRPTTKPPRPNGTKRRRARRQNRRHLWRSHSMSSTWSSNKLTARHRAKPNHSRSTSTLGIPAAMDSTGRRRATTMASFVAPMDSVMHPVSTDTSTTSLITTASGPTSDLMSQALRGDAIRNQRASG